jgi:hypothetical protein
MSQSEESLEELEIHWTLLLEKFFKTTAEKAHALSWCHKEAEQLYSTRTSIIDIPVIVLSIFNGAISVGSSSLFGNSNSSSIGVGMVALLTAIMNSINSYYGWARRVEAHKNASLNYSEIYTFLCVEMGLPREERIAPKKLVKMVRDDMNKLRKISPLIPPPVKDLFLKKFGDLTHIAKPEEMNGLEEVIVYNPQKDSERGLRSESFRITTPTPPKKRGGGGVGVSDLLGEQVDPGESCIVVKDVGLGQTDGGPSSESLTITQENEVIT